MLMPARQSTILIDTTRYAGNFASEMTAFCTGVYAGRGAEEAKQFDDEVGTDIIEVDEYGTEYDADVLMSELVELRGGDTYSLPCGIYELADRSCVTNTVGIFIHESDYSGIESETFGKLVDIIKTRAKKYAESIGFEVTGFRMLTEVVTATTTEL